MEDTLGEYINAEGWEKRSSMLNARCQQPETQQRRAMRS